MTKHAYCILAHADKYCLTKLLSLLDDSRNDIFLLVDKKTPCDFTKGLRTLNSRLFVLDESKRIDIRWGDISLLKAEFLLFEEAVKTGSYDYIHLISGADLPLKTQDYIHDFFSSSGKDLQFIAINEDKQTEETIRRQLCYYQFFTKHQATKNPVVKIFCHSVNRSIRIFQNILGIRRNWNGYTPGKGSQWVSITPEFAQYLIARKDIILKKFRYVKCADEIFIQSEVLNSPYKSKLYRNAEGLTDHMRSIEFNGHNARIKTEADYPALIASPDLFARKFSSTTDQTVIDRLCSHLAPANI